MLKQVAETTTDDAGTSTTFILGLVTIEEKAKKKNDVKAKSMLLMALPKEHMMTFNQYKDAKTLFAAIETRFGGNEAIKKTQKTILKQLYRNFRAIGTKSLDSIFNRLQKLVIQLAVLGVFFSQEDLNLKFLRSLPSKWNTHVFQNIDFVSSPSLNSTNEVLAVFRVSTASPQVTSANLSDATMYAFLANQPNGSQLVHEDLEQIHDDDLEEMDLKWKLALLSMRAKRFFRRLDVLETKIEIFENASQSMDKLIGSQVTDNSKKCLGYVSYSAIPPPHTRRVKPIEVVTQKSSVKIYTPVKENNGAPLIDDWESDEEDEVESPPEKERKTVKPRMDKVEVEIPKQNEKPARRPVKYAEMYRTQRPRGNQRNWNNLKSHQLGSNFIMYNKACYVCGSFNHLQARCKYHQRERMVNGTNHSRVNHNANAVPKAMLIRTGLKPVNYVRLVNPKRNFQRRATYNNRNLFKKVNTAKEKVNTTRPNSAVLNVVKANKGKAIKALACWVWIHIKLDSASIVLKKHTYIDARGRSKPEFDGGYVIFGGGAKGGKITGKGTIRTSKLDFEDVYFVKEFQFNLFSVSQMCEKKKNVLFTDTECFVLSHDFKLADESHVLLKVPRKNNMYSVDMKNINRVLVVKPYFKTPYELFRGSTPALSFMRPFCCHVAILNTLDHLGKFDGKSDEGFFVGYSTNSKAFRIYNTRTMKVEENLHIKFLENKPLITGDGPKWLFDIDTLTESMNYVPVIVGTNSNDFTRNEASFDTESETDNQERPNAENNTKDVNTFGPSINTASSNINTASNTVRQSDDFFGANDDMRSLDRVESGVQTRRITVTTDDQGFISAIYEEKTHKDLHTCLFAYFLSQEEPKRITNALKDSSWVEAMQKNYCSFIYKSFKH
nr:ribonuclease H-like domain-containing protein [Tanacetum cinerariifolium]